LTGVHPETPEVLNTGRCMLDAGRAVSIAIRKRTLFTHKPDGGFAPSQNACNVLIILKVNRIPEEINPNLDRKVGLSPAKLNAFKEMLSLSQNSPAWTAVATALLQLIP